MPDAPWITYYEEYRNRYYGIVEEEEEDAEADLDEE